MITTVRTAYQPYDSWIDSNGDGIINHLDLNTCLTQYGATGDPTKNVNVTNWPTAPLQNYTGTQEYTVLDASRMVNGTEHGVDVMSLGAFFAFSPKQSFIAVTNFSYQIVVYKEGVGLRFYNYAIDVNSVTVDQWHFEIMDYYPTVAVGHSPFEVNCIHPGINTLHVQLQEYMFILKLSVCIEYRYQA